MGAVYEAFDRRLSRRVAVKETLVEGDDLRQAFEREAHLLANLRHPALPKVLDHFSEAGGLFVVMEFIPGDDLGAMLEHERSFSSAEVLRWADQLLDALSYLHALDPPVLHRDIKPANLKLIAPNQIILLDFGLAKGRAGQMAHADSRSVLAYSPNYSPLEQIQGTGTDERSDLYALGATLYHLLTGVKPPDALTRATAVVNGQPDPLRPAHQLDEKVSATLSAAITRALALNIEQRPRTASEMLHDLHNERAQAATTVPIEDVDEITKINLSASRAPSIPAPVEVSRREPKRQIIVPLPEETHIVQRQGGRGRRWKWIVALTLAVGLVALSSVFYLFYKGTGQQRRTPTPTPTVRSSPRPTPSPTPTPMENANEQTNSNSQEVVGPAELEARSRLARKNIPFTEDAFTKVAEKGDTDAVDLFLAAGMSPDARDSQGKTALINAASGGSDEISRKLLSKGADPNARDNTGSTALMEAAGNDHKKTTGVLLENNSDVNLADNDGRTALIRAAARGHSEMVRILLNKDARVDLKDRQGRDALMWAEINDHSDVADLLRKAGAAGH
jgi:serine/threonine protein kinase